MSYEAKCVVDSLIVRERAMTSVVANAENSATSEPLEEPVCRPKCPFNGEDSPWVQACSSESLNEWINVLCGLDLMITLAYVEQKWCHLPTYLIKRSAKQCITDSPGDTFQGVLLVEFLRDGVMDLLQGHLW